MAGNIDVQQAILETPQSQPPNVDVQQVVAEYPSTQPNNIDVQQAVIELPFSIPITAPGTSNAGLAAYNPTTLYLWSIQSLPDQVYAWRSQMISHGMKGYQYIADILASYAAADTVTLSFTAFDGTPPATVLLPATASQLSRILVKLTSNKFRLIRYTCSSPAPFQVDLPNWLIRVGEWGRSTACVPYRLVGEG